MSLRGAKRRGNLLQCTEEVSLRGAKRRGNLLKCTDILQFFHSRRRIFICLFLCTLLFVATFWLYQLPLAAAIYPAVLCLLVILAFFFADFWRERRRYSALQLLQKQPIALLDCLPAAENMTEAAYQRLIAHLRAQFMAEKKQASAEYRDMMDYYTVWAHQIKTPIAAMRLRLQNEDTSLSRQLLLDLGRIEQYADMVLAYLRLDSSSTDYVIRDYELDSIVRPALRKFAGEFIAKRLKLDYSPAHAQVLTDEKWLGFVIEQLLSNALKYTPSGTISIYMEENLTLCIRDTGIGIAPEDLPRIFERGYTGYNGRSDRRASGIGLYLCSRICKNLGHTLRVTSEVGAGTLVSLCLKRMPLEVE